MAENLLVEQPLKADLNVKMTLEVFLIISILGMWILTDTFDLITGFDLIILLYIFIKFLTFYLLLKLKATGFILAIGVLLIQAGILLSQIDTQNILQVIILFFVTGVFLFFLIKRYTQFFVKTRN